MFEKLPFISLILVGLVLMTGLCLADVSGQLEQVETYKWYPEQAKTISEKIEKEQPGSNDALEAKKNLVISYISAKRGDQAQETLNELTAGFYGHSALPEALYEIAGKYEQSRQYEKAKGLYQQIMQRYPASACSRKAQLDIPKTEILSSIELRGDAADAGINSLLISFSGYSHLPSALYDIARRYERAKRYDKAKALYQQIVLRYPNSPCSAKAQLGIAKIDIYSLIRAGETKAAADVDRLIGGFRERPELPECLYDIAIRYERAGEYTEAANVYRQIIRHCPDSSHASRAQLDVRKVNVFSLIESEQTAADQQLILDNLIEDFAEHSYLPEVLWELTKKCAQAKEYEKANGLCQQIVQQYPQSAYAVKAQQGTQKYPIFLLIEAADYDKALAAINKLTSDFRGDSYLPWAAFQILRQYYEKAPQMAKETTGSQLPDSFQQAMAICEATINESPDSAAVPESCYYAGDYYRKLDEYGKSTAYYKRVVDDYSGFYKAGNALFWIGTNYEKMSESGLMAKAEAGAKIKAAYEQLITKYPGCSQFEQANSWLTEKN